jgi:hypothetical protein
MRKSIVLVAAVAAVLLGGIPLASAQSSGDQTAVHVPNRLQAQRAHPKGYDAYGFVPGGAHTSIVREPPGGLIQDRDFRESLGQHPESLQPLSSR